MRRYRYDLHTHSCLSPCGDNDMTPNNLVNMAALLGCEILAVTDHNTCRNAPAAVRVGEAAGVLVIPGMELCTAEEAHVVCLFEAVEAALAFDEYVAAHTMHIPNRPEIFGEQLILNERDEEIGRIDRLLITATEISVNDVQALVASYGGVAFPAHVDKDAYSVTAAECSARSLRRRPASGRRSWAARDCGGAPAVPGAAGHDSAARFRRALPAPDAGKTWRRSSCRRARPGRCSMCSAAAGRGAFWMWIP